MKRKGKGSLREGEEQHSEGVEEGEEQRRWAVKGKAGHYWLFTYNVNSGDKEAAWRCRRKRRTSSSTVSPKTRERSRGENLASIKNRKEEATLVNQVIPHNHLSSSSLSVPFATLRLKCKIVMDPTNNNSCFTVNKQFIFVIFFEMQPLTCRQTAS